MIEVILLDMDYTSLVQICGAMFCNYSQIILFTCYLLKGFCCSIFCFDILPSFLNCHLLIHYLSLQICIYCVTYSINVISHTLFTLILPHMSTLPPPSLPSNPVCRSHSSGLHHSSLALILTSFSSRSLLFWFPNSKLSFLPSCQCNIHMAWQ